MSVRGGDGRFGVAVGGVISQISLEDMFKHLSRNVRRCCMQAQLSEMSGAVGHANGSVRYLWEDFCGLNTHLRHAHCYVGLYPLDRGKQRKLRRL